MIAEPRLMSETNATISQPSIKKHGKTKTELV